MSAAVGALDGGVVAEALLAIDQLPVSHFGGQSRSRRHRPRRGLVHCLPWCLSWNNAGGNDALGAPSLLGLDADYLARQYRHFSEGRRGPAMTAMGSR